MVPARGVDSDNLKRTTSSARELRPGAPQRESGDYWSFSNDELIELELKNQLNLVQNLTNRSKLSLVTYSNGGLVALGLLASRPNYGRHHVNSLVLLGPAIYSNRFNPLIRLSSLYGQFLAPNRPLVDERLDSLARRGLVGFCSHKLIRYSACKLMLDSYFGRSDTFQTHFELSLLEHIVRPPSVRSFRQIVQIADSSRFARYDHGPSANQEQYGQPSPPSYELREVDVGRILLVSASHDAIADQFGVDKLLRELARSWSKLEHVQVAGYNHLDLVAAWDVAHKVNRLVLERLDTESAEGDHAQDQEEEEDNVEGESTRLAS